MLRFAVFGNPVSHSLSPQLHRAFARQCNIKITYEKIVTPLDQFKKTVDHFRTQGGMGANVTTPFKTQAFEYADQLTNRASAAGAVNTFIFKDNKCIADTTDGIGFVRALKNHDITLHKKHILILGAGGAVRTILGDIVHEKPGKIFLHNRTKEKARALANHFEKKFPIDLILNFNFIILIFCLE